MSEEQRQTLSNKELRHEISDISVLSSAITNLLFSLIPLSPLFPHRSFLLFSFTSLSFAHTHSASSPAPDVYWLPEFIQEHHLMCLLSCPAFVGRATAHNIANWSVSPRHPLSGFVKWTTITLAHSPIHDPTPLLSPPLWVFLSLTLSFLSFWGWHRHG